MNPDRLRRRVADLAARDDFGEQAAFAVVSTHDLSKVPAGDAEALRALLVVTHAIRGGYRHGGDYASFRAAFRRDIDFQPCPSPDPAHDDFLRQAERIWPPDAYC